MKNKRQTETYYVRFHKEKRGIVPSLYEIADSLKTSVMVIFILFLVAVRVVGVSGESMIPTLNDGDWLMVRSGPYSPERGDIVIITQPWERGNALVKRVIGLAGDEIDIDFLNGYVYINGEKQEEEYVRALTHINYDMQFPLTVPEGHIFVMGDNRNESIDSRSSKIGFIRDDYVLGKAVFRITPDTGRIYGGENNE